MRKGNTWAGAPGTDALAPHLRLQAVFAGPVDRQTGYLCNIKDIDQLLRMHAVEQFQFAYLDESRRRAPAIEMIQLLRTLTPLAPKPARLEELTLYLTPHLWLTVKRGQPDMVNTTYCFEFSAAHRLHCPALSEDDNRRIFGKCANPNGHGHNYVVEVTVQGRPDPRSGVVIELPAFERIVNETVIDLFDHKHLNADCEEFASLNPTVENITRVIYDKLNDRLSPARLTSVRVYETPKTYAEYDGASEPQASARGRSDSGG